MSVAVVTGSNRGFGFHGALSFARNGYTVVAAIRDVANSAALEQIAAAERLPVIVKALDVTRPDTFARFVAEVLEEAGTIDVLVNNAGVLRVGTAEDTSEESLRLTLETNFIGPVLLTQHVLPHMRERRTGYVIMVSSLSGIVGLPGDFSYTASKFALEGATEAMRHEVDRWDIKVALVEASLYATGLVGSTGNATDLPDYYPEDSPYRELVCARLNDMRERLPEASDPRRVGELFVEIAASDGSRLRWPADPVAERVLDAVFGHGDADRDRFARDASGTDWWSLGGSAPR